MKGHAYALWLKEYGKLPTLEQERMIELALDHDMAVVWQGSNNTDKQRALLIAALAGGVETR